MATAPSRKTILFQIQKKKFGGGKIQKMQRIVFLAGRALPAALQFSTVFLKIGSSLVVQGHQDKNPARSRVFILVICSVGSTEHLPQNFRLNIQIPLLPSSVPSEKKLRRIVNFRCFEQPRWALSLVFQTPNLPSRALVVLGT